MGMVREDTEKMLEMMSRGGNNERKHNENGRSDE